MPSFRKYRGASLQTQARGARGKSSVVRGQIFRNAIAIVFREHGGMDEEHTYYYTYDSAGESVVEEMKDLLRSGAGLNRYINANKPGYDHSADLEGVLGGEIVDTVELGFDAVSATSGLDHVLQPEWVDYEGS